VMLPRFVSVCVKEGVVEAKGPLSSVDELSGLAVEFGILHCGKKKKAISRDLRSLQPLTTGSVP
jgi:hypothetical protein